MLNKTNRSPSAFRRGRIAVLLAWSMLPAAWILLESGAVHGESRPAKPFQADLAAAAAGAPSSNHSNDAKADARRTAEFQFNLSNGYRRDDIDWNIAGNPDGDNPNVLSELTWDDIEIYQVRLQGALEIRRILYARGSAGYGWILDGDNQDSDYDADNRNEEYSRSNNQTRDDDVWDLSAGVGYPFRPGRSSAIRIAPMIGYSYHEQNLRITDGFQTIATPGRTPPVGPIQGLDSTYDTQWHGPWAGVDLQFGTPLDSRWLHRFEIGGSFEYHWLDYEAVAKWNLRSDLDQNKSFKHEADGTGVVLSAFGRLFFTRHWAVQVEGTYLNWSTDEGTDTVFLADGSRLKTQLNEVNWKSYSVMAGLTFQF
jgi:hypothetical protein